ncbi:hypothetical protein LOTGIDRAFT_165913 [Lottia gigantea]|uniref:Uncharacterized protein n=1 Tax=Lottia gigantea TaxID=225164 RepID=V3ZZS2_LOTGI|nr:hypothetical protein LOTGIDRAFT_165913 [Lottia gigantea]ESO88170.1 hypothetical protein LOTGIDRAFT_165913 [Lottia gigantea]
MGLMMTMMIMMNDADDDAHDANDDLDNGDDAGNRYDDDDDDDDSEGLDNDNDDNCNDDDYDYREKVFGGVYNDDYWHWKSELSYKIQIIQGFGLKIIYVYVQIIQRKFTLIETLTKSKYLQHSPIIPNNSIIL